MQDELMLSTRILRGGPLLLFTRVFEFSLIFIKNIVAARILGPESFGQLGVVILIISTLETLTVLGVDVALIQKKFDDTHNYWNVGWTVQIIRNSLLFLLLIVLAYPASSFFGNEFLFIIIIILSLKVLLNGFNNIGLVILRKEIALKEYSTYIFLVAIVEFLITIMLILLLKNVIAVVIGAVCGALFALFLSFRINRYRPRLVFNWVILKELLSFGKWVTGGSIVLFLFMHGDDFFVAKFVGLTALGLYQMAYNLSNTPTVLIGNVVAEVSLPTLSTIDGQSANFSAIYLRFVQLVAYVTAPFIVALMLFSKDLVKILLGMDWLPLIPPLVILSIWSFSRPFSKLAGTMLTSVGKPDLPTYYALIRLVFLALLIYPLTKSFGIAGTALSVTMSILIVDPILHGFVIKQLNVNGGDFLRMLLIPVFMSLLCALICYFVGKALFTAYSIGSILLMIILFLSLYFCFGYAAKNLLRYDIPDLFIRTVKSFVLIKS